MGVDKSDVLKKMREAEAIYVLTVSYTHLTLPTIILV